MTELVILSPATSRQEAFCPATALTAAGVERGKKKSARDLILTSKGVSKTIIQTKVPGNSRAILIQCDLCLKSNKGELMNRSQVRHLQLRNKEACLYGCHPEIHSLKASHGGLNAREFERRALTPHQNWFYRRRSSILAPATPLLPSPLVACYLIRPDYIVGIAGNIPAVLSQK